MSTYGTIRVYKIISTYGANILKLNNLGSFITKNPKIFTKHLKIILLILFMIREVMIIKIFSVLMKLKNINNMSKFLDDVLLTKIGSQCIFQTFFF